MKAKELTPDMAMRHLFRLDIAVLNHTASLKDSIRHLMRKDFAAAVKSLGRGVAELERACLANAKERGYKRPKRFGEKRR